MPQLTLREARTKLTITRQQLADRAGEKRSAIDDIETGRSARPNYVLAHNIFRALLVLGLRGYAFEDVFPLPPLPKFAKRHVRRNTDPQHFEARP